MKKIKCTFLVLLIFIFGFGANATTNYEIYGSEYAGWTLPVINQFGNTYVHPHMGINTATCRFDGTITAASYLQYFSDGLELWQDETVVGMGASVEPDVDFNGGANIENLIKYDNLYNAGAAASTVFTEIGSDNHVDVFFIGVYPDNFFTLTDNEKIRTCAHEIGHVFGLGDVYVTYNNNNIMYGRRSATKDNIKRYLCI